jgi:hypothetical protein
MGQITFWRYCSRDGARFMDDTRGQRQTTEASEADNDKSEDDTGSEDDDPEATMDVDEDVPEPSAHTSLSRRRRCSRGRLSLIMVCCFHTKYRDSLLC